MEPGLDGVWNERQVFVMGDFITACLHADGNDPVQTGKPMGTKNKVHWEEKVEILQMA